MAENTTPAMCSESEFRMAREAGLLIVTTAEEAAVHKFAEAVRDKGVRALRSASMLLERCKPHLQGVGQECCGDYAWSGDPEEEPVCCGRPYDLADLIQNELGLIHAVLTEGSPQ